MCIDTADKHGGRKIPATGTAIHNSLGLRAGQPGQFDRHGLVRVAFVGPVVRRG
jgi:hypothetical protein